jgi:hypothetical protein
MEPIEFTYTFTPELSRAATRRLFQHLLGWRGPFAFVVLGVACAALLIVDATVLTGIYIGVWLILGVLVVAAYTTRTRRNAALLRTLVTGDF